jgi:hypothetical protein
MYIAIALIAGIIAVLAVTFYYEIQLDNGQRNADAIPVATVFVTAVVTVTEHASTDTCLNNQTMLSNQTGPC